MLFYGHLHTRAKRFVDKARCWILALRLRLPASRLLFQVECLFELLSNSCGIASTILISALLLTSRLCFSHQLEKTLFVFSFPKLGMMGFTHIMRICDQIL